MTPGTVRDGDFIDLENPKVVFHRCASKRVMIGAERLRCALTIDGGVEHAADIGARGGATMHAEADKATREVRIPRAEPGGFTCRGPLKGLSATEGKSGQNLRRPSG